MRHNFLYTITFDYAALNITSIGTTEGDMHLLEYKTFGMPKVSFFPGFSIIFQKDEIGSKEI